jgi:hypothetical protein
MIIGLGFQQAMNLGLVLTSYDYSYSLSARCDCLVGLTAIYDFKSGLSASHDGRAEPFI